MSVKYITECDMCLKREEPVYKEGFPAGWISATLYIADNEYPTKNRRSAIFTICSTCYPSEFRHQDMTAIQVPTSKLKDIFRIIYKKLLTKL